MELVPVCTNIGKSIALFKYGMVCLVYMVGLQLYQWGLLGVLIVGYLPVLLAYRKQRSILFFLGSTAMILGSVMTMANTFNPSMFFAAAVETATLTASVLMFGSAYIGWKRLLRLEEGAKLGGVRACRL